MNSRKFKTKGEKVPQGENLRFRQIPIYVVLKILKLTFSHFAKCRSNFYSCIEEQSHVRMESRSNSSLFCATNSGTGSKRSIDIFVERWRGLLTSGGFLVLSRSYATKNSTFYASGKTNKTCFQTI